MNHGPFPVIFRPRSYCLGLRLWGQRWMDKHSLSIFDALIRPYLRPVGNRLGLHHMGSTALLFYLAVLLSLSSELQRDPKQTGSHSICWSSFSVYKAHVKCKGQGACKCSCLLVQFISLGRRSQGGLSIIEHTRLRLVFFRMLRSWPVF